MNSGSGDWWVYGEDKKHFFYFTGKQGKPYYFISIKDSKSCSNFMKTNFLTWCLVE